MSRRTLIKIMWHDEQRRRALRCVAIGRNNWNFASVCLVGAPVG